MTNKGQSSPALFALAMSSWEEKDGPALWWRFPVEEPPYVGSPLYEDFPDYVTHWTRIVVPQPITTIECPCCGGDGAESDELGLFYDGQALICGCDGVVSVCSEAGVWINADDCACSEGDHNEDVQT